MRTNTCGHRRTCAACAREFTASGRLPECETAPKPAAPVAAKPAPAALPGYLPGYAPNRPRRRAWNR